MATPRGNMGVLHPSFTCHKPFLPNLSQITTNSKRSLPSRGSVMTNLLLTRLPSFNPSFSCLRERGVFLRLACIFHFISIHIFYSIIFFLASSISVSLVPPPVKSTGKLKFPAMTKTNKPVLEPSPQIHLLKSQFQ